MAAGGNAPRAPLRVAVVFYGRIGGLQPTGPPSKDKPFRARDGGAASVPMLALCAAQLELHVLAPAAQSGLAVRIVGHSWNPEIGHVLDALFSPRHSRHEPPLSRAALRADCGRFRFTNTSQRGTAHQQDCERTRSQLLGLHRALLLRRHGPSAGRDDAVLVSRWDVLWEQPLPLGASDALRVRALRASSPRLLYWLPRVCGPREMPADLAEASRESRAERCGNGTSTALTSFVADDCADKRFCLADREHVSTADNRFRYERHARQLFVNDQWMVTSAAGADAFATIADGATFARYTEAVSALAPLRSWLCGHFYFGYHLLQTLEAQLLFELVDGEDFVIGRLYDKVGAVCNGATASIDDAWRAWADAGARGGAAAAAAALAGGADGPTGRNAATMHAGTPLRQPLGLLHSCGRGRDFQCSRSSRRCHELSAAAQQREPGAGSPAARALFLRCAAARCSGGGLSCTLAGGAGEAAAPTGRGAGGTSSLAAAAAAGEAAAKALLAMWRRAREAHAGAGRQQKVHAKVANCSALEVDDARLSSASLQR